MSRAEFDANLEAEVRAELRRTLVPPPVPEYVRDRVDRMAEQSTAGVGHLRRFGWVLTGVASVGRLGALAVTVAVVGAMMVWFGARTEPSVGSETPSASAVATSPADGFVSLGLPTPTVGYVAIAGSGVRVTADRGLTWSAVRRLPASEAVSEMRDVTNLDFVDAQHGWMTRVLTVGNGFQVVADRTADGGQSWLSTPVASLAADPAHPASAGWQVIDEDHFSDADHGIVLVARSKDNQTADCQRYTTADGGVTWSGPTADPCTGLSSDLLQYPTWVTNSLGYVVNQSPPGVSVTQDGGLTWRTGPVAGVVPSDSSGARLVVDLLVGDAAGHLSLTVTSDSGSGLDFQVLGSSDGGVTWTRQYDFSLALTGVDFVSSIAAVSSQQWFAALSMAPPAQASPTRTPAPVSVAPVEFEQTRLAETLDGGRTWSLVQGQSLLGVGETGWWDGTHGFATGIDASCAAPDYCGDRETIYITADGGRTWSKAPFDLSG